MTKNLVTIGFYSKLKLQLTCLINFMCPAFIFHSVCISPSSSLTFTSSPHPHKPRVSTPLSFVDKLLPQTKDVLKYICFLKPSRQLKPYYRRTKNLRLLNTTTLVNLIQTLPGSQSYLLDKVLLLFYPSFQ